MQVRRPLKSTTRSDIRPLLAPFPHLFAPLVAIKVRFIFFFAGGAKKLNNLIRNCHFCRIGQQKRGKLAKRGKNPGGSVPSCGKKEFSWVESSWVVGWLAGYWCWCWCCCFLSDACRNWQRSLNSCRGGAGRKTDSWKSGKVGERAFTSAKANTLQVA